jgi:diphthamide synthase subunit DPH2
LGDPLFLIGRVRGTSGDTSREKDQVERKRKSKERPVSVIYVCSGAFSPKLKKYSKKDQLGMASTLKKEGQETEWTSEKTLQTR